MPATAVALPVTGTISRTNDKHAVLVLTERLNGHDTFLRGRLELDSGTSLTVRILTLDDVTVLRMDDDQPVPSPGGRWVGILHLSHGWRPNTVPTDLVQAAERAGRDLGTLDSAELRYALTFLGESTTEPIRRARIDVIIDALPPNEGTI